MRRRTLSDDGGRPAIPRADRKKWLFAGSAKAGERAAAIMSLLATAKACGVIPQTYLTEVLTRLPMTKASNAPISIVSSVKPSNSGRMPTVARQMNAKKPFGGVPGMLSGCINPIFKETEHGNVLHGAKRGGECHCDLE